MKVVNVAGIDSPFVVLLAVVGLAALVSMILCSSLFFDLLVFLLYYLL